MIIHTNLHMNTFVSNLTLKLVHLSRDSYTGVYLLHKGPNLCFHYTGSICQHITLCEQKARDGMSRCFPHD